MSNQTPTPPQWQPPAGDPRAAAKAAKAYAKASRPWYKKKRWIGSIALVTLIAIVAATSGGGDQGSQAEADNNPPTSGSQQESPSNQPAATDTKKQSAPVADNSSKGQGAISWGNWEVVGKMQVSKDGLDDYQVVMRVKNTGDAVDTGLYTVTILKGDEILGTADCSTSDVNPGAVGTASCFSGDDFKPGWTEVTVENAF